MAPSAAPNPTCTAILFLRAVVYTTLCGTAASTPRTAPSFSSFTATLGQRSGSFAAAAAATGGNATGTGVFYPTAYGADPTGVADSTSALQHAMDAAAAMVVPGPYIGGLTNTGGAIVNLEGGEYRVSKPLTLGNGGGMRVCCGSLIASDTFPMGDAILGMDGHNEFITIEDVAFECSHRGGAVVTGGTLRVTITRVFAIHFAGIGIHVVKGHEVHITDSFLGEHEWGEAGSGTGNPVYPKNTTATAIQIDGQDHWISDIVIFYSHKGIVLNGGALVLSNTHVYNNGDGALSIVGHAVRVLGCYFDFSPVVVIDPIAVDISHNMFLGGVGIEIRSSGATGMVSGLTIVDNQFVLGDVDATQPARLEAVYLNTTAGMFAAANSTVISGNTNPVATYGSRTGSTQHLRQTVVRATLRQQHATRWAFDLTDKLLFPVTLAPLHVTFAVEAEDGFPVAVLRPVKAASGDRGGGEVKVIVVVESLRPFSGAVHLDVRQAGETW